MTSKAKVSLEQAESLVEAIRLSDEMSVEMIVTEISRNAQEELYNGVGKLTRKVYETSKKICLDERLAINASEIPETKDGLNYIIKMTSDSANSTIDAIEKSLPELENLFGECERLQQGLERFMSKEMPLKEFRCLLLDIQKYFDVSMNNSSMVKNRLNDVLIAQGFQDLTGQVINNIYSVILDVEGNLIELLKMFGTEIKPKQTCTNDGVPVLTGPSLCSNKNQESIASSQDEVDDLLSSLGF